jgi:hypothetical protein
MKSEKCNGCISEHEVCLNIPNTKIIDHCPCIECLVKVICKSFCPQAVNYIESQMHYRRNKECKIWIY